VLVFLPRDDPIACLNKAMAFMSTAVASCFLLANNQLKTSSRLRNHATIQKCTQPKRPRNAAWFKKKMLLAQAQESGQVLDEEQLAFLADPGITDCHDVHPTIIHNAAFQTDDLDAYASDYDDISYAKAVLTANLSSYSSDILSEVPQHDSYQNDDVINQSVQEMQNFEQSLIDHVLDTEITSDSNIIFDEQYLQQTQNTIVQDSNSSAQQDVMIMSVFQQMSKQMSNHDLFKDFDNDLHSEINKVKTVFNQMKDAVEQCSVDKKFIDIQKKEIFLDNDRLLDHIICQDVMNIVMHADSVIVNVLHANNICLVHDNLEIERKPDLKFLHVFGALCYPTNDDEDLGKLKPKADIGIFIGPELQPLTFGQISLGLIPNSAHSTFSNPPSKKDLVILFQPMFDEYFKPSPSAVSPTIYATNL
nr:hypothetical protein [Tanacetum cinerariifolium]